MKLSTGNCLNLFEWFKIKLMMISGEIFSANYCTDLVFVKLIFLVFVNLLFLVLVNLLILVLVNLLFLVLVKLLFLKPSKDLICLKNLFWFCSLEIMITMIFQLFVSLCKKGPLIFF